MERVRIDNMESPDIVALSHELIKIMDQRLKTKDVAIAMLDEMTDELDDENEALREHINQVENQLSIQTDVEDENEDLREHINLAESQLAIQTDVIEAHQDALDKKEELIEAYEELLDGKPGARKCPSCGKYAAEVYEVRWSRFRGPIRSRTCCIHCVDKYTPFNDVDEAPIAKVI